jgi:uncharacterized membrane-anchored protein YhcB (DUF1043 family)
MPPTVKSLDERIDGIASDMESLTRQSLATNSRLDATIARLESFSSQLATLGSQLATLIANQAATQNKLDVTNVKLDSAVEQLKVTDARIDAVIEKLDVMTSDYTAHKAKAETMFAFTKWIGAFVAGVFLTVLIAAFSIVRTAGSYEATIQQQQKTLEEIKRDVSELRSKQK